MNSFTERMSAVVYNGTASIHPNGRDVKRYSVGDGKIRRKAMKRLNARRNDHSATVGRDSSKTASYKMPGSMSR